MICKPRYIALIVCAFAVLSANAQQFKSIYLEQIFEKLPTNIQQQRGGTIGGFQVEVESDYSGVISEMGLKLPIFEGDTTLITSFAQRFFLDLMTATNAQDIENVLDRNKCKLYLNGAEYQKGPFWSLKHGLSILNECSSFDVRRDSLVYKLKWATAQNTLSLDFPANIQILMGRDKLELERGIKSIMMREYPVPIDSILSDSSRYKKSGSVYSLKGDSFLVDSLNSSTYYVRGHEGEFEPIHNPYLPAETMANLFLRSTSGGATTKLLVEQRMYGNDVRTFDVTLDNFRGYCKEHNLKVYIGFENITDQRIEATVTLFSSEYNYIHLLYVVTDISSLFNLKDSFIAARLYSYIPFDNVTELFDNYNESPKKMILYE